MGEFDIYIRMFLPERAGATVEGLERLFGLTTFQARELVHSVPRVVKRRVPAAEIARYARALAELGAVYEMRPCALSPAPVIAVGNAQEATAAAGGAQAGGTLNLPAPLVDPAAPSVRPGPAQDVAPLDSAAPSRATPTFGAEPPTWSVDPTVPLQPVAAIAADSHRTVRMYDAGTRSEPPPAKPEVEHATERAFAAGTSQTVRSYRTLGGVAASAPPSQPPAPSERLRTEPEPEPAPAPVASASQALSMAWAGLEPEPEPHAVREEVPADMGESPASSEHAPLADGARSEWVGANDVDDPSVLDEAPALGASDGARRTRRAGAIGGPPPPRERPSTGDELPLARAVLAATGARRPARAVGVRAPSVVVEESEAPLPLRVAVRALLGCALFLGLMAVRHCKPLGSDVERELASWVGPGGGGARGLPALDWMRIEKHQFVVVDKDRVSALVRELKGAGATEVYVTDVVRSGPLSIARTLLVELPTTSDERKKVLDVARDYAGDALSLGDVGQRTIDLPL